MKRAHVTFWDNAGPGPSSSAYRISGYCSICRWTGNVHTRLHRCAKWINLFLRYACYANNKDPGIAQSHQGRLCSLIHFIIFIYCTCGQRRSLWNRTPGWSAGLSGSVGCRFEWWSGDRGFVPSRVRQHSFVETDHASRKHAYIILTPLNPTFI